MSHGTGKEGKQRQCDQRWKDGVASGDRVGANFPRAFPLGTYRNAEPHCGGRGAAFRGPKMRRVTGTVLEVLEVRWRLEGKRCKKILVINEESIHRKDKKNTWRKWVEMAQLPEPSSAAC